MRNTSGRASDRRMPRRPRNGLLSSTVKPGDRLVAAGIDGADRHRLAALPIRAPCDRRGTASPRPAGRSALPNRNSVRISPTPSQVAMSMPSTSAGSATLTMHASPACRRRSLPAGADGSRPAPACGEGVGVGSAKAQPPRRSAAKHAGCRVRRRAGRCRRSADRNRTEPDHHRHAARARQHGDMARRTACRQRDAAAGASSRSRGSASARCRRRSGSRRRERPASLHARSARSTRSRMSLEVGGAGAEILVVGRVIAGDLGVAARADQASSAGVPSAIAARAGPDSASSASMAIWNSRMSAASPAAFDGERRRGVRPMSRWPLRAPRPPAPAIAFRS